jgi:hypothetical protein
LTGKKRRNSGQARESGPCATGTHHLLLLVGPVVLRQLTICAALHRCLWSVGVRLSENSKKMKCVVLLGCWERMSGAVGAGRAEEVTHVFGPRGTHAPLHSHACALGAPAPHAIPPQQQAAEVVTGLNNVVGAAVGGANAAAGTHRVAARAEAQDAHDDAEKGATPLLPSPQQHQQHHQQQLCTLAPRVRLARWRRASENEGCAGLGLF